MADSNFCGDCGKRIGGSDFLTEVNPIGGYGRDQLLVCDECMGSEKWSWWKSKNWPNWPDKRPW